MIATAKANNITVVGVYMNTRNASGADSAVIKRLTEDVPGGIYREAVPCAGKNCEIVQLSDEVAKDFLSYLDDGGLLKLSGPDVPSGADLSVRVNFADGTSASADHVAVADKGPEEIITGSSGSGSSWWQHALDWTNQNPIPAVLVVLAGIGAAIFGVSLASRRGGFASAGGTMLMPDDGLFPTARGAGTVMMPGGDTVILTPEIDARPPSQVYAWLQFLDADAKRVPIGSTNVRIGRSKDNDIILQNKTVHRNHALIQRSPEGKFSIHHVGGSNVVVINGQPAREHQLMNNDMIELGEVRMRFFDNL